MQPDFEYLYSQLQLEPGCTLEEFQRAYRRAIAELHPDRWKADTRTAEQQSQLQELISLHALATSFYRRHGRLPGAKPGSPVPRAPANAPPATGGEWPPPRGEAPSRRWLMPIALLAFVAWQLAGQSLAPHPEERMMSTANTEAQVSQRVPGEASLALGMNARTVLAIQGEPDYRGATDWHYGSSWLRFEDGRLVDWYDSPLRRLKTATSTPTE